MAETGILPMAQAQTGAAHPAGLIPDHRDDHNYVLDAAAAEVQKLVTDNDIPARALFVHTTIDSTLQSQSEDVVHRTVAKLGPKLGFSQAALVLMTPEGSILSLVGGVDYGISVFDRVTQAHRQPGSAFKPFVYLAAMEHGISPWELRQDEAVDIAGWQPENYQHASYGQLRLIDALARSVNTISVNLAQEVGVTNVAAVARRLGIASPLHDNASLALGTDEVTPLELTAAYGAFANGGRRPTPHLVSSLNDASGTVLYQRLEKEQAFVVSDPVRRDMTAMLFQVVVAGTGTAARLPGRDAAGKTGTTQEYRDAWFVGFTTAHVAGVWIGNDDNQPMRKVTGGTVPAQMWKSVMLAAETATPAQPLDRSPAPPEIKSEQVIGPAYLDDPMQGSTLVDTSTIRAPEIASAEPPPPVSASVAASVTLPSGPPPEQPFRELAPQAFSTQMRAAAPLQDTHLPEAASPPPPGNTPDAQALYRQRMSDYRQRLEEYRRVLRQATSPGDEDLPARLRDNDYRRPPDTAHEEVPFPR